MSDKPKVPDENDRLQQGKLSADAFEGTKRVAPGLRALAPPRQIGEPCDEAAEAALAAGLLWSASFAPDVLRATAVRDILPNGEPFHNRAYGDIYDGCLDCLNTEDGRKAVEHDPVAVASRVSAAGKGRDATSIEALVKLQAAASTVSEVQARAYAESIRKTWAKRCAIRDLRLIASDALSPKISDVEIYERAQKAALAMMERQNSTTPVISLKDSIKQVFIDLSAPGVSTVSTGLYDVDNLLNGGIRAPETSLVAARTGVGKSTFAVGVAEFICDKDPTAAALHVTLEMSHKLFSMKLLASRSPSVTVASLRRKVLNADQWRSVTAAVSDVATKDPQLYFTVSLSQTLASVFAAARGMQQQLIRVGKRLVLVIIDHVGLVKSSVELLKRANRVQQVAETSRGLRFIANEVGCHVMGLVQIHRDAERQKSESSIPKLHHLRESGDLEQDADQIFILHRPRDPKTTLWIRDKPTAIVLAKGRMDETGANLLDFQNGRYANWTDPDRTFESEYGGD
jgi:replicative DNA helicase